MSLEEIQQGVKKGVITAAFLTITGFVAGILFIPISLTPGSSMADRLAFALKADILVIFWLFYCIRKLGMHRWHSTEDIDGSGLTSSTPQAKMLQAILQNTLEQTVLAIVVHMIWAVVMPITWISGTLVAAILFFLGRALFIRGYAGGAPSRALGFALTFFPSMIMLLVITVTIVMNWAGYGS